MNRILPNKIILPKDELSKLYKTIGSRNIAKYYNTSKPTVLRNLREYKIPLRKPTRPEIKITRICLVCGKSFRIPPCACKKENGGNYCSKKCLGYAKRGEKSPHWKGNATHRKQDGYSSADYVEWRMKIYQRDNYTCQFCFKTRTSLKAHHIKAWSLYPDLRFKINNGITLCTECHIKLHHIIGWGSRSKIVSCP